MDRLERAEVERFVRVHQLVEVSRDMWANVANIVMPTVTPIPDVEDDTH